MAGYICARDLPNIGTWTNYTPSMIQKVQKKELPMPQPECSQHTIPEVAWNIPIPNKSGSYNIDCYVLYIIID